MMIQYDDSYEYPSISDLKKTTEKINQLHELGQGKLVILQELANNTLAEIHVNIIKLRKEVLDNPSFARLLQFGKLLRDIKTVIHLISQMTLCRTSCW